MEGILSGGPQPHQSVRSGVDTQLKRTHAKLDQVALTPIDLNAAASSEVASPTPSRKDLTKFVINEQARRALQRLGHDPDEKFDPKRALLSLVESSWRQQRVWETMLQSIPETDYEYLGELPIPGLKYTSRGARIDLIQRHLTEATKTAAKISKMAIDAGIEERMVRLAEEQSALIADTVRAAVLSAIGSLRLSPKAEAAAIQAALTSASGHLRMLASGIQDTDQAPSPLVLEGIAKVVRHEP